MAAKELMEPVTQEELASVVAATAVDPKYWDIIRRMAVQLDVSGEARAITVTYREQNPAEVYGVPRGYILYCRDYDTEHMDDCNDLNIDINGQEYAMTAYTHEETKGAPPAKQERFA